MSDANFSGFFKQSGLDDGTGDSTPNHGDYKSRSQSRDRHYWKMQGIDYDTGEVLDFKPKPMGSRPRSFNAKNLPKIPLPAPATLINVAIVGGIALAGYKLYKKFFGSDLSDFLDTKVDNGNKAIAAIAVDKNQSKADAVKSTAVSLSNLGLSVSDTHKRIADYFHDAMDTWWVDETAIVNTILKQNVQTFRLAAVAYGARTLKTYCDWHIASFASEARNTPITLKDSLKMVLSKDDFAKIHNYTDVI